MSVWELFGVFAHVVFLKDWPIILHIGDNMQIAVFINHGAACKRAARLKEKCNIVPVHRRGALIGYSVYQIKSQCWIMEP